MVNGSYSSTGIPTLKAFHSNGQLHGKYLSFYPSGNKKIEGAYKKGLKNGKWLFYTEKGLQEKMEIYEFGDIIKTVIREGNETKTIENR